MNLPKSIYEIPYIREIQITLNQLVSYVPPPPALDQGTPRKILLVTSHPVPDSFSLAIAKTVEDTAKREGHEVRRIDLGLEKFSPAMVKYERETFFDDAEQRPLRKLPRDIRGYLQKLQWCDTLCIVYPTWWMNTPANLKGFFDRTLLLHHAWHFPQPSSSGFSILPEGIAPGLTNIQRIVGISTYGASRSVVALSGDCGRNMISRPILQICHPDCTIRWLGLYDMDFTTPDTRHTFLGEVATLVKDHV